MGFVLPTTYARTRIYRPRREAIRLERFEHADVTEVHIPADDGLLLNGWYALSRDAHEGPRPLILYFSGTSGHRGYRADQIERLTSLGCDVLIVDYRGYGDNAGQPSERAQTRDARAIWRFAIEELHVPACRIIAYGESIGGAVAIRLVSDLCRQGTIPGGLVLQATFACMLDVVSQFFPRFLAGIFLIDRFPSVRRIRSVRCPILAIHGDEDRLIPIDMGRRLYAAAPARAENGIPKLFLELPGVGHNDIFEEAGEEVLAALSDFFQEAIPVQAPEATPAEQPTGLMQSSR